MNKVIDTKKKNEINLAEENTSNICGRSYNEYVPFTQVHFNAYQSILDQRNHLLGSVKSQRID